MGQYKSFLAHWQLHTNNLWRGRHPRSKMLSCTWLTSDPVQEWKRGPRGLCISMGWKGQHRRNKPHSLGRPGLPTRVEFISSLYHFLDVGEIYTLFKPLFPICKVRAPILPTSRDIEYCMRKVCSKVGMIIVPSQSSERSSGKMERFPYFHDSAP